MAWLLWDILVLLLLSLLIWDCASKGFLRKIVSFLGTLASAAAAGFFSAPAALWLYEVLVRDAIRAVLSRQVAQAVEQELSSAQAWPDALPGWASRMVPDNADLPSMPAEVPDVVPVVEQLIDSALAQPVLMLLRGLCFLAFFAILLALSRYISGLLNFVNEIPLLGSVNTVLGGVLGVGEAAILLYLLAVLAHAYIAYSGGGAQYISERTLSGGYLFSFFYRLAG